MSQDAEWVTTSLDPATRRYGIVLSAHPNLDEAPPGTVVPLNDRQAREYATGLLLAAATADHDATIARQLGALTDAPTAGSVIAALRADRPEAITTPIPGRTLVPGVSAFTGDPFIAVHQAGRTGWQWSPAHARRHSTYVRESLAVAALDGAYLRHLVDVVGLALPQAARAVGALVAYRVPEADAS